MNRMNFIHMQKKREQEIRFLNVAKPVAGINVKFGYIQSPVFEIHDPDNNNEEWRYTATITLNTAAAAPLINLSLQQSRNADFSEPFLSISQGVAGSKAGRGGSVWGWEVLPQTGDGKIVIKSVLDAVVESPDFHAYVQAFAWGETVDATWDFSWTKSQEFDTI